jgi:hypothetical protein
MWVIEKHHPGGVREIVGHHGIMPIPFSFGGEDLLFGKTENTFVHPAHRDRILYPRFEKRFAAQYEHRFDALFSTTGPREALRQRQALGYEMSNRWKRVLIGTAVSSSMAWLGRGIGAGALPLIRPLTRGLPRVVGAIARISRRQPQFSVLDNHAAAASSFFAGFWDVARINYGITARRARADLQWRYWAGPNAPRITIVLDSPGSPAGYAILRPYDDGNRWLLIEDIVVEQPTSEAFGHIIAAVKYWAGDNGIEWIATSLTEDTASFGGLGRALARHEMLMPKYWYSRDGATGLAMPRKITERGRGRQLSTNEWYVTPILFEAD